MSEYSDLTPMQRAMVQAATTRTTHSDTTGIIDSDAHFVIEPNSRKIINNSGKTTLVQGDHHSERLTFECPRYIEGHDMLNCNKVTVNYNTGLYEVDDLAEGEADTAIFTWLVTDNATKTVGKINFAILFECVQTDGKITYQWGTGINGDLNVISTISNSDTVASEYADVLEKWKQELIESGSNVSDEKIGTAVSNYLTAHPIEESDPTVPDWAKQTDKPTYTADEVGAISQNDLQSAANTVLAQAKASGEFNGSPGAPGAPGKSAYQYAQDSGYTGTESDFSTRLATPIPTALPNPQKLTFSGAVSAEYDGSGAVTVEIPENSGESMVRIEKNADDTTVEIQPNTLYIFPEMLSLTYTLAAAVDDDVASEYHFVFQSGSTATELVHPENVKIGSFTVESGYIYEISIMENLLCSQNWKI